MVLSLLEPLDPWSVSTQRSSSSSRELLTDDFDVNILLYFFSDLLPPVKLNVPKLGLKRRRMHFSVSRSACTSLQDFHGRLTLNGDPRFALCRRYMADGAVVVALLLLPLLFSEGSIPNQ